MGLGTIIIVDSSDVRRASTCEWLASNRVEAIGVSSGAEAMAHAKTTPISLILLRLVSAGGVEIDLFHELRRSSVSDPLIGVVMERELTAAQKARVLSLKADAFISGQISKEELLASILALIRQKRRLDLLEQSRSKKSQSSRGLPVADGRDVQTNGFGPAKIVHAPLRERLPDFYMDLCLHYETAIKQALQHRIYKQTEDVFAPFRQIAKELYLASATARDAVELHYQTLRKIAPEPATPRTLGYLEVGRTAIVGLLGDLLTFYRDASLRPEPAAESQRGPVNNEFSDQVQ
jgi:DNA-binding NarL/FixJ family response regulator